MAVVLDRHQAFERFCDALADYDVDKLASLNECPKEEFTTSCTCGAPHRTSFAKFVSNGAGSYEGFVWLLAQTIFDVHE